MDYQQIVDRFLEDLREVDLRHGPTLQMAVKGIRLSNQALRQLREEMDRTGFGTMSDNPHWEFILLSLRNRPQKPIGVMFCYKNQGKTYVPAFVGLDYAYVRSHHTYRQLLYQTIKRAIDLGFDRIDFGMTAAFEKGKLGATVTEQFAYVQASDNFTMELLGIMEREG